MRDLHFTLESLPPHLRAQAASKLGLNMGAKSPEATASQKIFAVPHSTIPEGTKKPCRGKGGMFKVNALSHQQGASETLLPPSPAGFKSIAEMRAEKKASRSRKYLTPDMAKTLVKSCEISPSGEEVRIILNVDCTQLSTAQQKGVFVGKNGKVHFFTKAKVANAEKTLEKALSPLSENVRRWGNVPISLGIDFCFPFPKSTPKKDLIHLSYHIVKPDLDNLVKLVNDSLTNSNFWEDDSYVSDLHLRKFRVLTEPFIIMTFRKLSLDSQDQSLFGQSTPTHFKDITEIG